MSGPPTGYIPPPPPPPPPEGWAPAKPTSGKAIAALVCGLAGPVLAFFCPVFAVALLVGMVLGIIAIMETGKKGAYSGRGMAIAGVVLSVLGVFASVGVVVGFVALQNMEEQEQETRQAERIGADQELLIRRLQQYCQENNGSLGPGGPVLAAGGVTSADNRPVEVTADGRVQGTLRIEHLAGADELEWPRRRGGTGWELVVTGQKTATLRARRWNGEVAREIEIRDAERGQWVQTSR